jgi:hypothetical protein
MWAWDARELVFEMEDAKDAEEDIVDERAGDNDTEETVKQGMNTNEALPVAI